MYDDSSAIDLSNSAIQCMDGGFVMMGTTLGGGMAYQNIIVIKTDCIGDTLWLKNLGIGDSNGGDFGGEVIELSDGTLMMCGSARDTIGSDQDAFLLSMSSDGTINWIKFYGGPSKESTGALIQTDDGGFLLASWTESNTAGGTDAYIVKTYPDGTLDWEKTIGGTSDDAIYSIAKSTDGGYVFAGWTDSYGNGTEDIYLLKVNQQGDYVWHKTYGSAAELDFSRTVISDLDSGFVIVGAIGDAGNQYNACMIKTDSNGGEEWREYYGEVGKNDFILDVKQLNDSSYILVGSRFVDATVQTQGWMVKSNKNGVAQWSQEWGNSGVDDYLKEVKLCSDDGYVATGQYNRIGGTKQDMWLIKTDSLGCSDSASCSLDCITCDFLTDNSYLAIDTFIVNSGDSALVQFNDSSQGTINYAWYFGDGATSTTQNPSHYFQEGEHSVTVTTEFGTCSSATVLEVSVLPSGMNDLNVSNGFKMYPNPNSGSFFIDVAEAATVTVVDISGRVMLSRRVKAGSNNIQFEGAAGIYFVNTVFRNGENVSRRLVRKE